MAPSTRPVKVIKLNVPRHNAQRIGNKLNAEVKHLAKEQNILVDTYQTTPDLAQAVESASEWNSMLITARAERGPQWDIGTQQFHVDQYSDLYYDPAPLLEVIKNETESEDEHPDIQMQQQHHHLHHPHQQFNPGHPGAGLPHPGQQPPPGTYVHPGVRHQTPHRGGDPRGDFHNLTPGMHQQMVQGGGHPHGPPPGSQMNFSPGGFPGTPGMNMRPPYPNAPFNAVPQNQFFNNDPTNPSPMRGPPGHMGGMNVNVGVPGGGGGGMPGMPGMQQRGMPPPGMNMPPEMRRMTRSMPEDYPMH